MYFEMIVTILDKKLERFLVKANDSEMAKAIAFTIVNPLNMDIGIHITAIKV